MPDSSRFLPFGPCCFGLLALFLMLRIGMSFLPCPDWGLSSYLCAGPYLLLPSSQPHSCVANAAIPEGVRLANRLDFLTYRKETLTVDENGYRNGPLYAAKHPQAVLFGTSFSLGMALSDEQTLASQINQTLGPVVYSAAGTFDSDLSKIDLAGIARRSGMQQGWILLEVLNRAPMRYSSTKTGPPDRGLRALIPHMPAPAISLTRMLQNPNSITRISTMLSLHLYDDHLFPNPYRGEYAEEELKTGKHVLMFAGDKAFARKPAGMDTTATSLIALRDDLARSGFHLAVILLPNSYSVYFPLLKNPDGEDGSEVYLSSLASRLSENGVEHLNLLPVLRAAAAQELGEGRMIYYPDDAHWNAEGCSIAAKATASWLTHLRAEAASQAHAF